MILLLDASSLDYQNTHYDITGEGKKSKIISGRLTSLYFSVLKLDLLQSIDFIILLNLDIPQFDLSIIQNQITYLDKVLDSFNEFSSKRVEYKRLLQTLRIFNYQDLGLGLNEINEQKLIDKKLFNIWSKPLKALLKDKEVMLLGEWVSQYSVLLSEHLPKIKLLKKNFFSFDIRVDNGFYEVVENREKYIKFYKSFYINRISQKYDPNFYKYSSNKNIFDYRNPFKNIRLKRKDSGIYFVLQHSQYGASAEFNKIIFIGNNNFFIERYLKQLPTDSENYYWFDCSENNFKIKPCMDGLVFKSVHKLTQSRLAELMSEISVGEYRNKPVFLLAEESTSIPSNNDYIPVEVPTNEDCKTSFPTFFFDMILEKPFIRQESIYLFNVLRGDLFISGNLDKFFNSLTTLEEIDKLLDDLLMNPKIKINLLHLDFWYDFINYYESAKFSNEDEDNKKPIALTFIYDVNTNKDNWIVTSNLLDAPVAIEYDRSLGIKIMAYLKEYPSCKKLDAIELRKKIRDYYGKEYKPQKKKKDGISDEVKNAYNAMREAAKSNLEKIFDQIDGKDQLVTRILKRFQFSVNCYYKDKEDVNVILTFNDPTLKNYPPTK